jgi:hypothetical protein
VPDALRPNDAAVRGPTGATTGDRRAQTRVTVTIDLSAVIRVAAAHTAYERGETSYADVELAKIALANQVVEAVERAGDLPTRVERRA